VPFGVAGSNGSQAPMVSHPDLRPRLSRLNPVACRRFPDAVCCRPMPSACPGAAPRPDALAAHLTSLAVSVFSFSI